MDYYPQHKDFIFKQRKTKKEKYGDENFNNQYQTIEPDIVVTIGNITDFPNIHSKISILGSKLFIVSHEEWLCEHIQYWSELFFDQYLISIVLLYF